MMKTVRRIWLALMAVSALLVLVFREVLIPALGLSFVPGTLIIVFVAITIVGIGLAPMFLFRR